MNKIKLMVIITISIFAKTIGQEQESICNDILKYGVYDYKATSVAQSKALWYVSKLESEEYSSYDNYKNSGFNLEVPIDDVLAKLNYSKTEQDYQQFRKNLKKYLSISTDERLRIDEVLKTINPKVVDAWTKCIETNGVHIYVQFTKNSNIFNLTAYFQTKDGSPAPRIVSGDFGNNNQIRCQSEGPFLSKDGKLLHTKLPLAITSQTFRRLNNEQIDIDINLNFGGHYNISIPAFPSSGMEEAEKKYEIDSSKVPVNINTSFKYMKTLEPNKHIDIDFIGKLKFLHIGTGGQCRKPALNTEDLDVAYPTPVIKYKFSRFVKNDWVDEGIETSWDGKLIHIFSKDSLRLFTNVRLFWTEIKDGKAFRSNAIVQNEDIHLAQNTKNCDGTDLYALITTKTEIKQTEKPKPAPEPKENDLWAYIGISLGVAVAIGLVLFFRKKR